MLKPVKDSHGRLVGHEFRPNLKMLRVVVEMNKAENQMMATEALLEKCGVKESEWARWQNEFTLHEYDPEGNITASRNHFSEWLDSALQIKSGEERAMLREVGLQKALAGEYNYWKDMSRTYGAVTVEPVEKERKTIPFNLRDDATPDEIRDARAKLLEANRAVVDGGRGAMVRLSSKRSQS